MIVISAGMRKAGSAWYYTLTNDLLVAAGHPDVREFAPHFPVRSYVGDSKIKCGRLDVPTLVRLSLAHALGHTYPVKTHSGPTRALSLFHALGTVRCTYVYRDPRDVVISILDHAVEARAAGVAIDLARLQTIGESIDLVKRELERCDVWLRQPSVHHVRYEHLVVDTEHELERLSAFLRLEIAPATLREIAARYERATYAEAVDRPILNALHLNKGVAGRFREVLSQEELALCNHHFAPYLTRMGYA
ncbi:MAG: hypothetical protein HKN04_03580 [Rhodothermaceae bacterium]|nr:hypothetical protein [Rhodothermaceae bacterium]